MTVSAINITIEQGADFSATYNIKNPDESAPSLTNYTIVGTLKKYPGAVGIGSTFTTTLNTSTAVATISLPKTTTASLTPGRHYYDLFLVSQSGTRTKIIEGNALVNASATLP
jgi:hypothetical protein